jgi:hypothetical protein
MVLINSRNLSNRSFDLGVWLVPVRGKMSFAILVKDKPPSNMSSRAITLKVYGYEARVGKSK